MRGTMILALVGVLAAAGAASAQAPGPAAPPADPVRMLATAKAALGDAAALAVAADLQAEQTGLYYAQEQGRDPRDAFQTVGRTYRWWFDADAGRLRREAEQVFPGGIRFFTTAGMGPNGGWSVDSLKWRTGVDLQTLDAAGARASRTPWERMFPHLALRQAEAPDAALRALPGGGLAYKDAAGQEVELSFDPLTGLVTRAQTKASTPPVEVVYGDYERFDGVMLPRTVQVRVAGALQEDVRLGAVRFGQAGEERFTPPPGYAPPPTGETALRTLAPGVQVFENMPAGYRSAVVEAADHLVLLEAPLNPAYGDRQKTLLDKAYPGKRVRYVVVTHAHGDHTGGLKPWVEGGAVLIAPKGAGVALRRQLAGRGLTRPVTIEEVEDRRTLGSGAGRLDLYAFSGSHSEANLLAHLPGARVLFQGDLLYVPERGPPPVAFPVVDDLMAQIRRRRLAVSTILGVHGRPATMAEAEQSLRLRR